MKLTIVLLALVGLVAAASVSSPKKVTVADREFLERQKFLFEIVYRVEDPLMFEEHIKTGHAFVYDKAHYTHYDHHMEKFYESYKMGALLPRGEFFGALVKTHYKQAYGLFNFFYYAKDWETFQANVAWARIHVNEGMFVYALTLAVIHRDDFKGLILPSIYEIFPQYFFNSKFIYEAEKFDYQAWSKYIQYEKELHDVYHKENRYYNQGYFYVKDFKIYQWWRLMGLGEQWYAVEKSYPLRENSYEFVSDDKYVSLMKNINMFWHPVDYTRDIKYYNEHSALSYFTEDLGWNSYWYYLNMDYAFFLDGETFGLNKDRRGEWWLYNVDQILSRYYFERLSHGFGEIDEFSWNHAYEYGYDSQLISYNGVGFSSRSNYFHRQSYGKYDLLNQIQSALKRIYDIIDYGYYTTVDGHKIDMRKPESIEYIGSYMQSNVDTFDKYFFSYWYMLSHMYFADVDYNDFDAHPNVFLNFETMMRDPMFYSFYKVITDVYYRFNYHFHPYTHDELEAPGVQVKDASVSELVTYFDLVDIDVTNLLNDKMVFDDGKFVWDKSLLARQIRLNHKPFHYDLTVESDKAQKVVIRTFLGPKFDEYGRIIPLSDNRMNFIELDEFVYEVVAGENVIKRSSEEFYWNVKDRTTYTELYHYVMAAYDGKYELPLDISEPHCGFPDRLILPKGWESGFPVQFFFIVAPYDGTVEQYANFDYTYYCGIGSGARHVDSKPFGYPFDRPIDESQFFVPNVYFKDVSIYHNDTLKQYYENYKNYGHFDYNFYNHYYTKYFN
ncbi:larval serum protein 1 beta chain-like [Zeugodacus cucurbitae]|uniref:larval serum protein 1 beta chain-like n=1 Tax=Zeugodacus cucurbitae TaxID=28588 RepID=UPI0023D8EB21|nr:larval serum protein 1 beta chain-like [Zeugodacus cucurbitae]